MPSLLKHLSSGILLIAAKHIMTVTKDLETGIFNKIPQITLMLSTNLSNPVVLKGWSLVQQQLASLGNSLEMQILKPYPVLLNQTLRQRVGPGVPSSLPGPGKQVSWPFMSQVVLCFSTWHVTQKTREVPTDKNRTVDFMLWRGSILS